MFSAGLFRTLSFFALMAVWVARAADRPNVVLIYADDVGWGDVGCYGATSVRTPNIDRLAREGLRFTDAHSPSATCTPSRYAMLTGEYAWRRKGTGVLPGDAALILDPARPTLASRFRTAGYRTGVVGKWHLGLGPGPGKTDWNGEIRPGAFEVGFDHSYLMPATGDRVPCVYVENGRVVDVDPADPITVRFGQPFPGEPTGKSHPGLLRVHPSHGHDMTIVNGISRIGYMTGGKAALWRDEDMADVFTREARRFIASAGEKPFFLYFSLHDIHVPRVPHPRYVGRTGMGPRGDVLVELDDCVGAILGELTARGLDRNTLVIFTSDNGPVVDDGYRDDAVERLGGHRPAGPFRGGKYSKFEGGTRVPLITWWPGRIRPGVSDALVCQVDFPASFGALTGTVVPREDAPDSVNLLGALLGDARTGRDHLVEHANGLALREGPWKFIPASSGNPVAWQTGIETGNAAGPQLYDLATDPSERRNLAGDHPDRVRSMAARLEAIRTRDGAE